MREYQKAHHASGHVWQGRFRAFPIQQDDHLLTVLRYIERNPLRAALVTRAEDWRWSSLCWHLHPPQLPFLDAGPVVRPTNWADHVNAAQTEPELAALRRSSQRGTPFEAEAWATPTAVQLGLEFTVAGPGTAPQIVAPCPDRRRLAPPFRSTRRADGISYVPFVSLFPNERRMRSADMETFETSATVGEQRQVLVAAVPFAPGTEVEVAISPKRQAQDERTPPEDPALAAARDRMRELFRTIKGFRNSPRIAREDLYERGSLR